MLAKIVRFPHIELMALLAISALYSQIAVANFTCNPTPAFSSSAIHAIDQAIGSISLSLPVTGKYVERMQAARYFCHVPLMIHVFSVNIALLLAFLPLAALLLRPLVGHMLRTYEIYDKIGENHGPPALGIFAMGGVFLLAFFLWLFGTMTIPATSTWENRLYEDPTYLVIDPFSIAAMLGLLKHTIAFAIVARIRRHIDYA